MPNSWMEDGDPRYFREERGLRGDGEYGLRSAEDEEFMRRMNQLEGESGRNRSQAYRDWQQQATPEELRDVVAGGGYREYPYEAGRAGYAEHGMMPRSAAGDRTEEAILREKMGRMVTDEPRREQELIDALQRRNEGYRGPLDHPDDLLPTRESLLNRFMGEPVSAGGGAAPPAPSNALANVSQSQPQSNYLGDIWDYILGQQTYTGPRQQPDSDMIRILKNWAGPRQLPVDMNTSEGQTNRRVNDMLNPWTFMSKDEWNEPSPRTVSPGITQYPHQFGPLHQPRGAAPPAPKSGSIDDFKAWLKANPDNPSSYLEISKQLEAQQNYNANRTDYTGEGTRIARENVYSRFPSWGGMFNPLPLVGAVGRTLDPRPLIGSIGSGLGKMHDTVFPPAY